MDTLLDGCRPAETSPEEVDVEEVPQTPNKRNDFSHKILKTEFGSLPLSL